MLAAHTAANAAIICTDGPQDTLGKYLPYKDLSNRAVKNISKYQYIDFLHENIFISEYICCLNIESFLKIYFLCI